MSALTIARASIANTGTESAAIDLREVQVLAIYVPAGFEGTTIGLTVAPDPGNGKAPVAGDYLAAYDDGGTEIEITVAASRYVVLTGDQVDAFAAASHVKLQVDAQTGAIELKLVVAPLS